MTKQDYIDRTNKICGEFFCKWIPVEPCVTLIISRYFCHDKSKLNDLDTFINNTKDFRAKIILLEHIMKLAVPEKEAVTELIKNIWNKYELRNHFAHDIIEIPTKEFNANSFNFISIGKYTLNESRQIVGFYDMEKHETVLSELDSLLITFHDILKPTL